MPKFLVCACDPVLIGRASEREGLVAKFRLIRSARLGGRGSSKMR